MAFKSTLHEIPRRYINAAREYEQLHDQIDDLWYELRELSKDTTLTPNTVKFLDESKQYLAEALERIRASRSRLNGALQTISCEGGGIDK